MLAEGMIGWFWVYVFVWLDETQGKSDGWNGRMVWIINKDEGQKNWRFIGPILGHAFFAVELLAQQTFYNGP